MLPSEIFIGTLASKMTRAVKSIHGPHIDKEGKPFQPDGQQIMTLKAVMDTAFPDDRHFTAYSLKGLEGEGWPRLSKQSLASFDALVDVEMYILTFDWDCPNHTEWDSDLYSDFFAKLYTVENDLGNWR